LRQLSVPFSDNYVDNFLRAHENYPSLSSISALLNDFKVDHIAIRISQDQLFELTFPCIAFINAGDEASFVVLEGVSSQGIKYNLDNKAVTEPLAAFVAKWQGIILLASVTSLSRSHGNDKHAKEQKQRNTTNLVVVFLVLLVLILTLTFVELDFWLLVLVALKISGVAACWILFANDVGLGSKLYSQICSIGQKSNGCEKVTRSKAGTIFGFLKLSEIGLFYFVGGVCFLLVAVLANTNQSLSPVFMLSVAAVPYSLFSIYYQVRVKQVCVLCTLVMVIIWLETTIFLHNQSHEYLSIPDSKTIILGLFCYTLPIIFWLQVREFVVAFRNAEMDKAQLAIFKKSKGALSAILDESKLSYDVAELKPLVINAGGSNRVLAVLSLFCKPCGDEFLTLRQLILANHDTEFSIIIHPGNLGKNQILRTLLNLKIAGDSLQALDYLKSWYSLEAANLLSTSSDLIEEKTEEIESTMASWQKWLAVNSITSTPSIFINGFRKPNIFSSLDFNILFEVETAKMQHNS
jgi:hypothetical protein